MHRLFRKYLVTRRYTPFLDLLLRDIYRTEKPFPPRAAPYIRNEEVLMVYECNMELAHITRRGHLMMSCNYVCFTHSESIRVLSKWAAVDHVTTNARNEIVLQFYDGSDWCLYGFFDTPAARKFISSLWEIQKASWNDHDLIKLPCVRPFFFNCLTRCLKEIHVEMTAGPTHMPPANPIVQQPQPYRGDGWVKKVGGHTPNMHKIFGSGLPQEYAKQVQTSSVEEAHVTFCEEQEEVDSNPSIDL